MRLLPDPLPPSPPGGHIPTRGVFCDNAMNLVLPLWPKPTKEDLALYVKTAMKELNKVGLVGVMDAAVAVPEVDVYDEYDGNSTLNDGILVS